MNLVAARRLANGAKLWRHIEAAGRELAMVWRCAVVGLGHFGCLHAQKWATMEGASLVAMADIAPEARAAARARWDGVACVADWRALPEIDAASIATPAGAHSEAACGLASRGVHILVEKPLAATLAQADAILAAAAGVVLQVGHIERFNPAYMEVAAGAAPRRAEFVRRTPPSGRAGDVDVTLDLMIHDLDLACALMGAAPVAVEAEALALGVNATLDAARARLIFAGGREATIEASRVSDAPMRALKVWREDGVVHEVDMRSRSGVRYVGEPSPDPLRDELHDFMVCAQTGAAPRVGGAAGRLALSLALQVVELARA